MNISFLYPTDPFSPKKIDEAFAQEASLVKERGFEIYLINTDEIESSKVIPVLNSDDNLIYRGWMLNESSYRTLYKKVNNKLLTSPEQYLYSHHLPNWYPDIKDYTMNSMYCVGEDIGNLYKEWGNKPAFVKDYVKSLKTGNPPIISSQEELISVIANMKKFRGCIEGGIVLRDAKPLLTDTESRFFVLNGNIYNNGSLLSLEMNDIAQEISKKVTNSTFFSIDLVKDSSGKVWLVEIGDGQVSDSVGWSQTDFVNIFNSLKLKSTLKPK